MHTDLLADDLPAEHSPGGAVDLAAWLDIVEREYLADFVPAGGAAV
jgi:hypothetical protein